MSGTSGTYRPPTSAGSRKSTCSRGSAAGPSLFDWLDGVVPGACGPAPAPASPTAAPARGSGTPTPATSGPPCSGSSASAALTSSLASRLRALCGTGGSTEFVQTWREKATPSGRRYSAHTARGRRTSDSGSTGWPTPDASGAERGPDTDEGWKRESGCNRGSNLNTAAALASWPTPTAHEPGGTPEQQVARAVRARARGGRVGNTQASGLATVAQLAGWATPKARDERGVNTPEHLAKKRAAGHGCSELVDQAQLAGWMTPTVTDSHGHGYTYSQGNHDKPCLTLVGQARTTGPAPSSSPAATGSSAGLRLNPSFSLWLQGYPVAWACCGAAAMRSVRKRPRSSSRRTAKPGGRDAPV
jgi:hypothetical protein